MGQTLLIFSDWYCSLTCARNIQLYVTFIHCQISNVDNVIVNFP